jgi:hypothetical protein
MGRIEKNPRREEHLFGDMMPAWESAFCRGEEGETQMKPSRNPRDVVDKGTPSR